LFAEANKVPDDFVATPAVSAPVSFSNTEKPEAPSSFFLSAGGQGVEILRVETDGTIKHQGEVIGCEPVFLRAMQYVMATGTVAAV
jgi:hypothetical protein